MIRSNNARCKNIRSSLIDRRSYFSKEQEDYMIKCTRVQYIPVRGEIPYRQCWKMGVNFAGSVLRCQHTPTNLDVMVTFCVEGKKPVNLSLDTGFNGLWLIHQRLIEHHGEDFGSFTLESRFGREFPIFDPPMDEYEYSCEVDVVESFPAGNDSVRFVLDESPGLVTVNRVWLR